MKDNKIVAYEWRIREKRRLTGGLEHLDSLKPDKNDVYKAFG